MARTHVIVSDEVLGAIDELVGERGRSRFLEEAAREKLGRLALAESILETRGLASGPRYEHWRDRRSVAEWVARARDEDGVLTDYLLDTTALIAHLRGDDSVTRFMLAALAEGHVVGTCCVNIAEVTRGTKPKERREVDRLLKRLTYFDTSPEAARRAGEYQARFAAKGTTLHTPDALIAGTARSHGAIVVTDNVAHFPMRDARAKTLPEA